jgi:cation transport ATPase
MSVDTTPEFTEADVLRLAAAVERGRHLLAPAVVAAAQARGLDIPPVSRFVSTTGQGVTVWSKDARSMSAPLASSGGPRPETSGDLT